MTGPGTLPLTYDECRARFRLAAAEAGVAVDALPLAARGPEGQHLTIDVATIGMPEAGRLLVVLSGVHGVEGFIGSALQWDLLGRLPTLELPTDVSVLLVHAVNPWGMAWGRRQNESNVDLNRNWRRDDVEPVQNDAYDELHHLACPDTPELPDVGELLTAAAAVVEERGIAWVRDAITRGQYRHPDGLHFGGDRTEESNRHLERLAADRISGRERVLVVDLHTGHGPRGEVTLLSDAPPGHPQDVFLRRHFPGTRVEATAGNPAATTGPKSGQIANGIRAMQPPGVAWATSAEIGTSSDLEQLAATYLSQWVHRRGDPTTPEHAAANRAYRACFTPDDPAWVAGAMERGRDLLDQAVAALADPDDPRS